MGVVSDEIGKEAVDRTGMNGLLSELDLDKIPQRYQLSLIRQNESLRMTIPKDSWESAGHDLENPGEVEGYHYEHLDLLLVDLDP
jgi:hypothetical protein